jgi:hypothetical protein
MRASWRGEDKLPPQDEDIQLVATTDGRITLARYFDDLWVEEYMNAIIDVAYWMPIPVLPNE